MATEECLCAGRGCGLCGGSGVRPLTSAEIEQIQKNVQRTQNNLAAFLATFNKYVAQAVRKPPRLTLIQGGKTD